MDNFLDQSKEIGI